jgi:hypothetical protein
MKGFHDGLRGNVSPVHAVRMELDVCHFPDKLAHVFEFFCQNTDVMWLDTMTQIYAVFCYS